ncbi:MAG TPA: hypothetical protein VLT33_31945 [Labilithrix sp.]|nr:hypothetical protein [Labilithrix sp.]
MSNVTGPDMPAYESMAEIRDLSRGLTAWRDRERTGVVRVSREGVFVDGALEVPSEEIGEVFYSQSGAEHILHLRDLRGDPKIDLVLANVEAATTLLAPLSGARTSRQTVRVRSRRSSRATVAAVALAAVWMLASVLWPVGLASAVLLLGIPAVPMLIALAWLRRDSLELGSDGMLVTTHGRKRFVRYDAVSDVETVDATKLRVVLLDGEVIELELVTRGRPEMSSLGAARDALLVHLRAALRAARATHPMGSLTRRIARGGRPREAWLADIASLRNGAPQYRESAVREEDLWEIVESSSAPEDARAAAALLLRGAKEDAPARVRLRVASEAIVSKKLRIAIEAAAGSDDAAAEEALEDVTDDVAAEHRRAAQD